MAMTIYTSSDEQWCFAEQVTWGTAIAPSTAGIGLLTESFGVDSAINFNNPNIARAQRYSGLTDLKQDQKGIVYQTEGMNLPALTDNFDFFLYGLFQRVSEGAPSARIKSFSFPQTQPDFTDNAGKFYTLWNVQPVGSTDKQLYDAIVSELVLSCAPESNEGILWVAPTFVGRYHSDTQNYSGTITYPTPSSVNQKYFYDLATIEIDDTAVIIGDAGFTLTLRNNAQRIGVDTANNVFNSFVLPRYDVELNLQILWDATARTVMANAKAGTSMKIELFWETSQNTNGALIIVVNGKCQNAVDLEHAIEGNFVTLNIVGGGTFDSTKPCRIEVTNYTNRGW